MRFIDLTNKRFGKLTVIRKHPQKVRNEITWECLCDCGNTHIVAGGFLRKNHTKSCGCFQKEYRNKIGERTQTKDSGFNHLYNNYKRGSQYRNLTFELSKEDFQDLTSRNCFYCGVPPMQIAKKNSDIGIYIYNGIDRKDNSIGYTKENCLPCCSECNFFKTNMDFFDFIERITLIYENLLQE